MPKIIPSFKITKPIVLVGLMGAGKTRIGKILAQILNIPFIDSDMLIQQKTGLLIKDFFQNYGEKAFREQEQNTIIENLNSINYSIISTGGGAFINPVLRTVIKTQSCSIWVKANLKITLKRVSWNTKRPLLNNQDNLKKTIIQLRKERYPFYQEADIIVHNNQTISYAIQSTLYSLDQFFNK
ncbi:MAG: shikimate kinase [Alphaproteobacteria bacterium]|nr:shikimate kinase [Alphaproteobacteria bacterium]